jgi:hypothetical protein
VRLTTCRTITKDVINEYENAHLAHHVENTVLLFSVTWEVTKKKSDPLLIFAARNEMLRRTLIVTTQTRQNYSNLGHKT